MPDGTGYRATEPWLLAWVHVAGAINFLDGWRRYAEPRMSRADQDRYFDEAGEVARMLDADPVPRTRAEAERLIAQFRCELRADERSRAFRDLVLKAPAKSLTEAPVQLLLMNAAVDLMPKFARRDAWPVAPDLAAGRTRRNVRHRQHAPLGVRGRAISEAALNCGRALSVAIGRQNVTE